jgi:hypothetical protein
MKMWQNQIRELGGTWTFTFLQTGFAAISNCFGAIHASQVAYQFPLRGTSSSFLSVLSHAAESWSEQSTKII